MIPRVRPSFHLNDLGAALMARKDDVTDFENELASYFGVKHALMFPYGRSAIYALLQGMGLQGEVVQPAYNCVVVAHATVMGGCHPVFVDAQHRNPNQDFDEMVSRVSNSTSVVIPTSIFGIPFDGVELQEAIRRRNPNALVVMDCSQSFSAGQGDVPLVTQGDVSVLAFGIGKPMTSIYGGALLTNRDDIHNSVRNYRNLTFKHASWQSELTRWFYFMAAWTALTGPFVSLTDWLEHSRTPLYSYLQTLRSREAIQLPVDNSNYMKPMEAAVGRQQLKRASSFIDRRRKIAIIYEKELAGIPGLEMLEWGQGSSYAIYSIRLSEPEKRPQFLASMRKEGVQGDTVLSYVVPDLDCYSSIGYKGTDFPNSLAWSQSVVNLPNHPTMSDEQIARTVKAVQRGMREIYA